MEAGFEISPSSDTNSDCNSIPYSHMNEEEAQIAYSARKNQIKAMLKARSTLQTPESNQSKCTVSSTKSKKSTPQLKQLPTRFTTNPEKVSKAIIDLPLQSQQQLKERLKHFSIPSHEESKKYDISEPIYKRTVDWKQNIQKAKEEKKTIQEFKMLEKCTFEPVLGKSEIRNMSVGIYERHLEWRSSIEERKEQIKNLNQAKEIEECSFKPKLYRSKISFDIDFQERNIIWQEHVMKKSKRVEEESKKKQIFAPRINKNRKKHRPEGESDNRFSEFLSKINEISNKIDKSLASSVL
ncbi:hypothetical protein SteCoe_22947 [Stentor coeruleus]|uniref:Uncharacterized protein n=1 Tax=Stentor coeruleus TaxID=5963 RepID=A0A1R2BKZ3_9CILI|nr:hypothetical protein SteCoe_22947 [Stentor coeruleus]